MSGVRRGRAGGWPVIVAAAGTVLCVAGLVLVGVTWRGKGLVVADSLASVLGLSLAIAGAVAGLVGWALNRRRVAGLPATADEVNQAVANLADMVREQWDAEARARGVDGPDSMPVRWKRTSRSLMDPAAVDPDESGGFTDGSARIEDLVTAFRNLRRRRLVITGGGGTGKTTLAVRLLRELLPAAGIAPTEPVPVLLSIASFNPDTQPDVRRWLADQLRYTYPALRAICDDAPDALVTQSRVLPILDGLDEVDRPRRAAIIDALNTTLPARSGLILTSRRDEYRDALKDAGRPITAAEVIGPSLLSGADAADYLRRHLPPFEPHPAWEPLLKRLATDTTCALAETVRTPLGLWLVRAVYLDTPRDPTPLNDDTHSSPTALRAHLLDELIPALIAARPPEEKRRRAAPDTPLRPDRRHRPEDLRCWLTTIAEQLRDNHTTDWRWWHLPAYTLTTPRTQRPPRTAIGLVVGLVFGLAAGLAVGLVRGLATGLAVGLVAGLIVGLVAGLEGVDPSYQPPPHALPRIAGRIPELRKHLVGGLAVGLAVWLTVGLVSGLGFELVTGLSLGLVDELVGWLVVGLVVGLTDGTIAFLKEPDGHQSPTSPNISFYGSRTQSWIQVGIFGLVSGLVSGLSGLVSGLSRLAIWLAVGRLLVVLEVGLAGSVWFEFLTTTAWQKVHRRGCLPAPRRVMPMLRDCHRLGLLRTVGPVYQFRHSQLQDHLAPPRPLAPRVGPTGAARAHGRS
jgi:NACHT domain